MGRVPVPKGSPLNKEQAREVRIQIWFSVPSCEHYPIIFQNWIQWGNSSEICVLFQAFWNVFCQWIIYQNESRNCPVSVLNRSSSWEPPEQQQWRSTLTTEGRTCASNQQRREGKQSFVFQALGDFGQERFPQLPTSSSHPLTMSKIPSVKRVWLRVLGKVHDR